MLECTRQKAVQAESREAMPPLSHIVEGVLASTIKCKEKVQTLTGCETVMDSMTAYEENLTNQTHNDN